MWDIKDKVEQRKWGKYLKNARIREEKEEIYTVSKKNKQY